jgi:hypothetical protein
MYKGQYLNFVEAVKQGGVEGLKASKSARAEKALMTQKTTSNLREVTEDFNEKLSKEMLTRFQSANDDVRVAEEDIKKYLKNLNQSVETLREKPSGGLMSKTALDLPKNLLGKKGTENNKVAPQSYYNDPLEVEGFTRNAGGAPEAAQKEAISTIIEVGRTLQASDEEIAYALATARHESGFNKFAAAKSTSAYGLGQFVDDTGSGYGLTQENRDDLQMQAQALIEYTQYNTDLAEKRGQGLEYVYKYHHDGPTSDYGGLSKSKKHIMPYVPQYLEIVKGFN